MISFSKLKRPIAYIAPSKARNIDNIDFSIVTSTYRSYMSSARAEYTARINRVKKEYEQSLNLGEASYEGGYDELNIKPFNNRLDSANQAEYNEFMERFAASLGSGDWLFPQIVAKFAKLDLVKGYDGKYSGNALFAKIRKNEQLSGMLLVTLHSKRSLFIKSQLAQPEYCALVPTVLYAFKKFYDINYEEWSTDLEFIVEQNLFEAMMFEGMDIPSNILGLREAALQGKPSHTTYSMFHPSGSPLRNIPRLAAIMYCQTWAAHPSYRNKYMILDPRCWDALPEPLIHAGVLTD